MHRNLDDLRIDVYKTPAANISNDNLYILHNWEIDILGCFGEVPIWNEKLIITQWVMRNNIPRVDRWNVKIFL